MTRHLTPLEISELIAANGASEGHAHLSECERCRRELLLFDEVLHRFGNAVRTWSLHEEQIETKSPRLFERRFVRLLAAIASMVVISLVAVAYSGRRIHLAPAAIGAHTLSDVALLNQIQTDISQPVPVRLQPLLVRTGAESPQRGLAK